MDSRSSRRQIGIMGGSYNPVHVGHLIIAQDAVEQLCLDELIFIPALTPPHKQHDQMVSADKRLKMLQQAVQVDSRLSVSDFELNRGGISYTYETVKAFIESCPESEIILIVGSDTLVDLHNWHRIEEILELCSIASFMRPSESNMDEIKRKIKLSDRYKSTLIENIFKTHLIEISSSDIRERLKAGRSIKYRVPKVVEEYIYKHNLYLE